MQSDVEMLAGEEKEEEDEEDDDRKKLEAEQKKNETLGWFFVWEALKLCG